MSIFKYILGLIFSALALMATGANWLANWIGRSTIADDAGQAAGMLNDALYWFLGLPAWGTGLFSLGLLGLWGYWLFSDRMFPEVEKDKNGEGFGPIVSGVTVANRSSLVVGNNNTINEDENPDRFFGEADCKQLMLNIPLGKPVDFVVRARDPEAEKYASQIYWLLKKHGYRFVSDTFVSSSGVLGGGGKIGVEFAQDHVALVIGSQQEQPMEFYRSGGMASRGLRFE